MRIGYISEFSRNFPAIVAEFGELASEREYRRSRNIRRYTYYNHCWGDTCGHRPLNSRDHDTCEVCGWLICPDCDGCEETGRCPRYRWNVIRHNERCRRDLAAIFGKRLPYR